MGDRIEATGVPVARARRLVRASEASAAAQTLTLRSAPPSRQVVPPASPLTWKLLLAAGHF